MHKVKAKKTKAKRVMEMIIVNPYAAGIDVSDKEHVVAVPEGVTRPCKKTIVGPVPVF